MSALEQRLIRRGIVPRGDVAEAMRSYRRFLELKAVHRDEDAVLLSPSLLVDSVWHAHILDTKDYARCCAALLGEEQLLHHDPDGDADSAARARRVANTRALYKARFGEECAWAFDRAPSAQPEVQTDGSLMLRVSDQDGNDLFFKCKPTAPLESLMASYCKTRGLSMLNVRFLFDGERFVTGTPQGLGMKDGDVIDAIEVNFGC